MIKNCQCTHSILSYCFLKMIKKRGTAATSNGLQQPLCFMIAERDYFLLFFLPFLPEDLAL